MSNKILMDSSVLIEYRKGTKVDMLNALIASTEVKICINQTVASEYLFHHLAIFGGKAPRTLKEDKSIGAILRLRPPMLFLENFIWLSDDDRLLPQAIVFMERHNLLPNDALILAACKIHGVEALASHDAGDFQVPCAAEGVALLQSVADFEAFKKLIAHRS